MRYLPQHNITFIHNPKTAGTSVSQWLDDNFITIRGRKHGNHVEVKEFFPKTVYTFGVVRDPWERMVSWYLFAGKGAGTFEQWLYSRLFHNNNTGLTFNPEIPWSMAWYKLSTPQADWFGDDINCVLRYENLQEEFAEIKKLLTCNKELPIINCNEQYDYRKFYNDDTAELVRDVFIKDVIRYGYEYKG